MEQPPAVHSREVVHLIGRHDWPAEPELRRGDFDQAEVISGDPGNTPEERPPANRRLEPDRVALDAAHRLRAGQGVAVDIGQLDGERRRCDTLGFDERQARTCAIAKRKTVDADILLLDFLDTARCEHHDPGRDRQRRHEARSLEGQRQMSSRDAGPYCRRLPRRGRLMARDDLLYGQRARSADVHTLSEPLSRCLGNLDEHGTGRQCRYFGRGIGRHDPQLRWAALVDQRYVSEPCRIEPDLRASSSAVDGHAFGGDEPGRQHSRRRGEVGDRLGESSGPLGDAPERSSGVRAMRLHGGDRIRELTRVSPPPDASLRIGLADDEVHVTPDVPSEQVLQDRTRGLRRRGARRPARARVPRSGAA